MGEYATKRVWSEPLKGIFLDVSILNPLFTITLE